MIAGLKDRLRCKLKNCYPGPRGFFFSPHERAAREPRSGEKEKPLVTLDLNLTFMQTLGSGSDHRARIGWYFYKHENKYDWSVWLAIPRRRWGYLSLHFSTRERIWLQNTAVLSLNKRSKLVCVLYWFCFWQCGEIIWPLIRGAFSRDWKSQRTSLDIKALLLVINRKDVFAILPDI